MYNGLIIKQLLEARKIRNSELIEYLNYQPGGGNTALKQIIEGNPTVRRLEPIADFFQVSMDVFFERAAPYQNCSFNSIIGSGNAIGNGNKIVTALENEYIARIESLTNLLIEKDKRIETLEYLVEVMKK